MNFIQEKKMISKLALWYFLIQKIDNVKIRQREWCFINKNSKKNVFDYHKWVDETINGKYY